jgi:SulP family sulfate permease
VTYWPRFKPRSFELFGRYRPAQAARDISAGITVGIVAIPLAMAFAIASGLKPEAGLITAVIAGLIISGFGGSAVQIGGPAGAFIVVVYSIIEQHGLPSLLLATMMAGVLLIGMGLIKLGNLIRHVPVSIIIGFTNGIAALIALSQVKDFFGLAIDPVPAEFFAKVRAVFDHINSIEPITTLLGVVSVGVIILWPRPDRAPRNGFERLAVHIPGTIIALSLGTIAVSLFHLPVETIGTRFGGIPSGLPAFRFPEFDWVHVRQLFGPTVTLALLCAIESLLCARVADSLIEDRHDPNQELIAQGFANIAAPLFGGFCATGTIARTVTNIRSGGRTPVAGLVHGLTVLVVMVVAAPLAVNVPLAGLAAILMVVAYNMGEWSAFIRMRRFSMNYRVILVTTFLLTVIIDLSVAVEVGLGLACLFFITRVSSLTKLEPFDPFETLPLPRPDSFEAFNLVGSLFFGAVSILEHLQDPRRQPPKLTIIDLSGLLNMDTTGLESLETLDGLLNRKGGKLLICAAHGQPKSLMQRSGFLDHLGPDRYFETKADMIAALTAG